MGWELHRTLPALGHVIALDRSQMDLTQPDAIRKTIRDIKPDIIVNAAGYTTVDQAEAEPGLAMQINAVAPGIMAAEAKKLDALLVHYSTDYVFDGTKTGIYCEEDLPNPVNVYGKTKLAGEESIAGSSCRHLILRASWIYGARGINFLRTVIELARTRKKLKVVADQIGSPTWVVELASTTASILQSPSLVPDTLGTYHLSADDHTSRFTFAQAIVEMARRVSGTEAGWADVEPTTTADYPTQAARPLNAATSKAKIKGTLGITMPQWEKQLRNCLHSLPWNELQSVALRA